MRRCVGIGCRTLNLGLEASLLINWGGCLRDLHVQTVCGGVEHDRVPAECQRGLATYEGCWLPREFCAACAPAFGLNGCT